MNKSNIVIILARKKSKRIKNKNLIKIFKKSLICHSIETALESKLINSIYVSSDSEEIEKITKKYKINFIKRPSKLCSSTSTSEDALEHAIKIIQKKINLDNIVFLQPTSPLRPKNIIDLSLKYFYNKKADSLFSSSLFVNHIWEKDQNSLKPINYNYKKRQREQDKKNQFNENGSFYIFNSKKFLKYKNRLFGKIINYDIDTKFSYQLDEKRDINIIEALFKL